MATAVHIADPVPRAEGKKKTSPRFYAPELDALRFVAFLLVFCRHVVTTLGFAKVSAASLQSPDRDFHRAISQSAGSSAMSSGWSNLQGVLQSFDFGVCLFFFLSSFLITRLLLVERNVKGDISVRDFYIRRSLRIWPLYFTFLAVIAMTRHFFPSLDVSASRIWCCVFFVANWAAVLHGWGSTIIQPLWSVSVEEQFYLIWPNVARRGKEAIIILSVVLAGVAIGTLYYFGNEKGVHVTQVWPNSLVQCLFLSAGALTACLSSPELRRISSVARLAMAFSGLVLWVVASARFHVVRNDTPGAFDLICGYLLVLLGTILIFSAAAGWKGRAIPSWLLYLGKISYGLYVFHVACLAGSQTTVIRMLANSKWAHLSPYLITGVSDLLGLLLTLMCASMSYRFIEFPFLRLKDRFARVQSRPA